MVDGTYHVDIFHDAWLNAVDESTNNKHIFWNQIAVLYTGVLFSTYGFKLLAVTASLSSNILILQYNKKYFN